MGCSLDSLKAAKRLISVAIRPLVRLIARQLRTFRVRFDDGTLSTEMAKDPRELWLAVIS